MGELENLTRRAAGAEPLDKGEIRLACDFLFDEARSVEARAAFLSNLHRRRETPQEIAGFVHVLLERGVKIPWSGAGCLDVCGTGGDKAGLFNISTTVFFVAAGAGARLVKHGNRGITSKSGGADVLEALGIDIHFPPDRAETALERAGCCFLFAPDYHPTFRAVAPVRQFLGARGEASLFNIIGPLLNPARPEFQLAGVFDPDLLEVYGAAMTTLGRRRAWAVHGTGPEGIRLDEVSTLGPTMVTSVADGKTAHFELSPGIFGPAGDSLQDLQGSDAAANARIIHNILAGSGEPAQRRAVAANTAAALVVCGRAGSLAEGLELASESIDSGNALEALKALRET